METIALADTNRQISRLGFGCSSLMGAVGRKSSLRLLETAYDNGIRHFDVAPLYGYGEAENCLGEFLQLHRGAMTVTTKYGLAPAKNQPLLNLGRATLGPLIRRLPSLKKQLSRAAQTVANDGGTLPFTATEVKKSLEHSLRALKTDCIDIFLLHEATADALTDDGLHRLLEDLVSQGTIGSFGIGSESHEVPTLLQRRPQYCNILQFEWSIFDQPVTTGTAFRIHHRSLSPNFKERHASLLRDEHRLAAWSQATRRDLRNPQDFAALLLKAALEANPHGVIMFSSKASEHIERNARVASDESLIQPAMQLLNLAQSNSQSRSVKQGLDL